MTEHANQKDIKIIHTWTIPVFKNVEEVTEKEENGQIIKISRPVRKEVPVKMGIKKMTRRERSEADLFYGVKYNHYINLGFNPRAVLVNKLIDISGGTLSEKERLRAAELYSKKSEYEYDLIRAKDDEKERKEIQKKISAINAVLIDLSTENEAVFSQTADSRAQNQLNTWLALTLTYIEENGKWKPYFKGETFEEKEAFMWKLEEDEDEFYGKCFEKVSFYIGLFARGINTPEQFAVIEEELKKQLEAKKEAEAEGQKSDAEEVKKIDEKEVPTAEADQKETVT